MIIAIDGPAAAGKGTLAHRLAEHFGLAILDTGLLYRAVGMKLVRNGQDTDDPATAAPAAAQAAETLTAQDLEADDLRIDAAADAASQVSAFPAVRAALLEFQRSFAANPPDGAKGAVLDGRDIGTIVCPDADHKLFVTASAEVRAERRFKELRERGLDVIHGRVLADMKERDTRDSQRTVSPLEPAKDAFLLDTSDLDADQAFAAALKFIHSGNK